MYTINILSSQDFDKLGTEATKGSDISNSLGFANKDTGQAYVRFTAMPELNFYLIDHEFEELIALESTHEDKNGIRHKAFPGLGSIIGSLGSGAATVGKGALSAGKFVGQKAIGGAKAIGGSVARGLGTVAGGVGNLLGQFGTGFGGKQQLTPQQIAGGGALPPTPFVPAGGVRTVSAAQQATSPVTPGVGVLGKFQKELDTSGILGATSLATGLFKGLPQAPDISGITGDLRSQLAAGQARGQSQLQPLLDREFSALTDEEITAATRQIDEAEKRDQDRIRDVFRNIRPGTSEFTDTALAKELGESSTRFAELRADAVAGRTRTAEDRFNQQRLQQIQLDIGANQFEMQQLAQIAQLSVLQIAQQLQIDLDQAQQFKDVFTELGGNLLLSQFGTQPTGLNINVGV